MELAGLTTIGKELGMSKQGADWQSRNDPSFPKPLGKEPKIGRIWRMRDVRRYRRTREAKVAREAAAREAAEQKEQAAATT